MLRTSAISSKQRHHQATPAPGSSGSYLPPTGRAQISAAAALSCTSCTVFSHECVQFQQQTSQLLFLNIGGKIASSIDYLNHFIAIKLLWFQSASVSSSPFCMGGGRNAKVASAVLHECLTQNGRKDKQHSLSCTASVGTLRNWLQISQVSS